jgi:hypothetical protein
MVCHWPGIYYNCDELGFNIFKEAVLRVHARNDNLIWMKLSEIARYWSAKELTEITRDGSAIALQAPFASPNFTLEISAERLTAAPVLTNGRSKLPLREVSDVLKLEAGTFTQVNGNLVACFDLSKGESRLTLPCD